jgi:hypothetical protein
MLDIYTNAFIYEPTTISTDNTSTGFTYIHDKPPNNVIHPYLKEFIQQPLGEINTDNESPPLLKLEFLFS